MQRQAWRAVRKHPLIGMVGIETRSESPLRALVMETAPA